MKNMCKILTANLFAVEADERHLYLCHEDGKILLHEWVDRVKQVVQLLSFKLPPEYLYLFSKELLSSRMEAASSGPLMPFALCERLH